jgi:hypothetical protein
MLILLLAACGEKPISREAQQWKATKDKWPTTTTNPFCW